MRSPPRTPEPDMKIYSYCSYTGSPVGFIMGCASKTESGTFSKLDKDGIPGDIRACFENAIIQNAAGNLNIKAGTRARWILLLKNIEYRIIDDENRFTWYINMAFETDSRAEFERWIIPAMDLGKKISQCLRVDKANAFGLTLDDTALTSLMAGPLADKQIPAAVASEIENGCCFEFQERLPEAAREKFLAENVLRNQSFNLSSLSGASNLGWSVASEKKKLPAKMPIHTRSKKKLAAGLAAAFLIALCLGWLMSTGENPEVTAQKSSSQESSSQAYTNKSSAPSGNTASQWTTSSNTQGRVALEIPKKCLPNMRGTSAKLIGAKAKYAGKTRIIAFLVDEKDSVGFERLLAQMPAAVQLHRMDDAEIENANLAECKRFLYASLPMDRDLIPAIAVMEREGAKNPEPEIMLQKLTLGGD